MKIYQSKLLSGVAIANCFLMPISAIAQENTVELEPIVVENYNKDRFAKAADRNTAIYISEDAINAAQDGDMKDLFSEEASVTVGGGIPIAQKIYVNGVDQLMLNVTIDGAMQNNRAFHHTTANAIDPGLLKAVRIDAGVAPADAGPNALAGSIAFQTLDATDLLVDGKNFGGKALLSFDTNSETFSQALTLYARAGNFDVLGYVKNAKGEDYTTGSNWIIPGTAADLQSFLVKGGFTSDAGDRLEISAQILNDKAFRPFRANFGGLISGSPTRLYDTKRKNFAFNYSHLKPGDMWDPEVTLGYSVNEINVPVPYGSEGTSDTLNGKLANTFTFNTVNTVTAGADFYIKSSNYIGPASDLEEEIDNVGFFAQARLQPFDPLKVSFGVRYDRQGFEGIGDFSDTVDGASGNASVAYEIIDGLTLKAGYSNIFGGIVLEDNYVFSPAWDYTGLKSSRARNVNTGFEFKKSNFRFSGEIFSLKVTDARVVTGNVDFESKGFNLAAGYNWVNGRVSLTYSNSDVKVNKTNASTFEALDLAAPLGEIIAFNISHTFLAYNLTVGGSIQAALGYETKSTVSNQDITGYTVVNLFAEYKPEQLNGLSIRLAANNLFDKDYADRGTYGQDFASVLPLKEPGRSFLATASYEF